MKKIISTLLFILSTTLLGGYLPPANAQSCGSNFNTTTDIREYHYFATEAEQNAANLKDWHKFKLQPNILTHSQAARYCEDYMRIAGKAREAGSSVAKKLDCESYMYCVGSFMPFVTDEGTGGNSCEAKTVRWMGVENDGVWKGCTGEINEGGHLSKQSVSHNDASRGDNEDVFTGSATFLCQNGDWRLVVGDSSCAKLPKKCDDLSEEHEWLVTFPSWANGKGVQDCHASLNNEIRTGVAVLAYAENEGVERIFNLDGYNFEPRYVYENSYKALYCFDGEISDEELNNLVNKNPSINPNILNEICHYDPMDCRTRNIDVKSGSNTCAITLPNTAHEYSVNNPSLTENGTLITTDVNIGDTTHGRLSGAKCFDGEWDFSGTSSECYQNPVCGDIDSVIERVVLEDGENKRPKDTISELNAKYVDQFTRECSNMGGNLANDFDFKIKGNGSGNGGKYSASATCEIMVADENSNFCSVGDEGSIGYVLNPLSGTRDYFWKCKNGLIEISCGDETDAVENGCLNIPDVSASCSGDMVSFSPRYGSVGDNITVSGFNNSSQCSVDLICEDKSNNNIEVLDKHSWEMNASAWDSVIGTTDKKDFTDSLLRSACQISYVEDNGETYSSAYSDVGYTSVSYSQKCNSGKPDCYSCNGVVTSESLFSSYSDWTIVSQNCECDTCNDPSGFTPSCDDGYVYNEDLNVCEKYGIPERVDGCSSREVASGGYCPCGYVSDGVNCTSINGINKINPPLTQECNRCSEDFDGFDLGEPIDVRDPILTKPNNCPSYDCNSGDSVSCSVDLNGTDETCNIAIGSGYNSGQLVGDDSGFAGDVSINCSSGNENNALLSENNTITCSSNGLVCNSPEPQPSEELIVSISKSDFVVNDAGCLSGSATAQANVSGGQPNYTYIWSKTSGDGIIDGGLNTNKITVNFDNVCPNDNLSGTYRVIVADQDGNNKEVSVNLLASNTYSIVEPFIVSINGENNITRESSKCGSYEFKYDSSVSGGKNPFNYEWSVNSADDIDIKGAGDKKTVRIVFSACPNEALFGDLNLTVTDKNGNKQSDTMALSFNLESSVMSNLTVSIVYDENININSNSCDDISVPLALDISGGTAPYQYSWSREGSNITLSAAGDKATLTFKDVCPESNRTATVIVNAIDSLNTSGKDEKVISVNNNGACELECPKVRGKFYHLDPSDNMCKMWDLTYRSSCETREILGQGYCPCGSISNGPSCVQLKDGVVIYNPRLRTECQFCGEDGEWYGGSPVFDESTAVEPICSK